MEEFIKNNRTIVEMIYFCSQILLFVVVTIGLSQISMTRRIAKSNVRRDAAKLSAEISEKYVDIIYELSIELEELESEYNVARPQLNGYELTRSSLANISIDFINKVDSDECEDLYICSINLLNKIEHVASCISYGVIDGDLFFKFTGSSFIKEIKSMMPYIAFHRENGDDDFCEAIISVCKIYAANYDQDAILKARTKLDEAERNIHRERIKKKPIVGDDI